MYIKGAYVMSMNGLSEWIWMSGLEGNDIYCDFYDEFYYSGVGKLKFKISADSNYALYINGVWVESGQYPDYPYYKIYDEFDVSEFCRVGKNSLAVTVWHYGAYNMSYFPGNPAVRYEVLDGERIIAYSKAGTLCRQNVEYQNGLCKGITPQLGFSFHYDATAYDGWMLGALNGFVPAVKVDQELPLSPRPIKKLTVADRVECETIISENGTHFLYDIGREEVGYLTLKLTSETKQKLLITFGEHIIDGCVRRRISVRDFSVEVTVGAGETVYMNPYRRLGLRYLEVFAESPIVPEYVSVRPVFYPLNRKKGILLENELDRRIYDVCVRTLELCMHEHYEDCPWREQALYCMDSRNQMLCGYPAFGETEFPRANLKLMSKERREDGLLSICFPTSNPLAIPSFSLHFFTQVWEYYNESIDREFLIEIYPKLCSVLKTFTDRIDGSGCAPSFVGKQYWNFYEWSDGLAGNLGSADGECYEAALNLMLIIALRNMSKIAEVVGKEDTFKPMIKPLIEAVRNRFYKAEEGIFYNREDDGKKSELVNALAVLAGAVSYNEACVITDKLADPKTSGLTPATLSMLCFKYDAILVTGNHRDVIIEDIREKYGKMLDEGATSFWETEDGAAAFGNAGSLCHGWSALPIYYYEIIMNEDPIRKLYK